MFFRAYFILTLTHVEIGLYYGQCRGRFPSRESCSLASRKNLLRGTDGAPKNDNCQDFPHADAASQTRLYTIFQLHKRSILLIINDS